MNGPPTCSKRRVSIAGKYKDSRKAIWMPSCATASEQLNAGAISVVRGSQSAGRAH